jgi:hypothetical protein
MLTLISKSVTGMADFLQGIRGTTNLMANETCSRHRRRAAVAAPDFYVCTEQISEKCYSDCSLDNESELAFCRQLDVERTFRN